MKSANSWIALEADGDEPAARARWLERALVGLELPTVIAELAAITAGAADLSEVPPESVRSWLGPDATAVLEQGLAGLPRCKLDELFRRPGLLVGLQELALTEGGPYWNGLVRQDDATNVVAARHRNAVLGRLGPPAMSQRRSASTPGRYPSAAAGRPLDPPETARRPAARSRRLLVVLAPLSVAATMLVALVLASLWKRSAHRARPGDERVVTVKAVVPDGEGDRPGSLPAPDEPWPAHPWQGILVPEKSPATPATDLLGRIAGSREWSRRLDEARDLSATQVRAAAERARDAVSALETLAASDNVDFSAAGRTMLKSRCQTAKAELDQLRSIIATDAPRHGSVARAKADIVRVLTGVEGTLVDACSQTTPPPENPAKDGEASTVHENP